MTGSGNWTYFVPGRVPLLIDAGVGHASHLEAIAQARGEGPGHVVATHAHADHVSGAEALLACWPGLAFSKWPWPERDGGVTVPWKALADRERIPAGDGELEVVHTPGHAPDHIALWDATSGMLFTGDLVVSGTTVVILASAGGSLRQYLASLERILTLQPKRLLPAHGTPIEEPEKLVRQYLRHRHEREEQVLAGLRDGACTVDALVARIYVGLSPTLLKMAGESVLAHLQKLEEDGVIRQDGEHWF